MSDPFHKIFQQLGEIQSSITHVQSDITEIKTAAKETRKKVYRHEEIINRAIGYAIAASAAVGGAVAFVPKSIAGLFK